MAGLTGMMPCQLVMPLKSRIPALPQAQPEPWEILAANRIKAVDGRVNVFFTSGGW
jgi:hypothetical protein